MSRAYPTHLESEAEARDGTLIHLRPVRPDDEPLLRDLAAHMIEMCRDLGFTFRRDPNDATLVDARKRLAPRLNWSSP